MSEHNRINSWLVMALFLFEFSVHVWCARCLTSYLIFQSKHYYGRLLIFVWCLKQYKINVGRRFFCRPPPTDDICRWQNLFFLIFHDIKYLLQLMKVEIINTIQLKCKNAGNILNSYDDLRGKKSCLFSGAKVTTLVGPFPLSSNPFTSPKKKKIHCFSIDGDKKYPVALNCIFPCIDMVYYVHEMFFLWEVWIFKFLCKLTDSYSAFSINYNEYGLLLWYKIITITDLLREVSSFKSQEVCPLL